MHAEERLLFRRLWEVIGSKASSCDALCTREHESHEIYSVANVNSVPLT